MVRLFGQLLVLNVLFLNFKIINMHSNEQQNRNDSQLTGATYPFIFPDGTQLFLSPLSDKDLTELDNWVKSRYLYDVRKTIPEDADEATKDRIERIAQQTASTLSFYSGLGAAITVSLDGMTQLIFQSAKRNHKDLTYEKVHELMFQGNTDENVDRANEIFSRLNDLDVADELKDKLKKKRRLRKRSVSK